MTDNNLFTRENRLINEKSPYLLQHAYNPVEWYPWGEEAFEKARAEDKPIFLSCGYSTCHWCHVMERESFEDEEVARVLNQHFVAIKVDREERPDIDSIYMSVCQAMTGSGGWPLTIIMDPDKKPFFAGTYFPKHSQMGRPGVIELLQQIANLWVNEKNKLIQSGAKITTAIAGELYGQRKGEISREILDKAYDYYAQKFDPVFGGFGSAPKFPTPHNLSFLLRYWQMSGQDKALAMAEKTIEAMYRGGIYDHIGFGFARYSTDRRWLVPHFEKMLYDNALLAMACLETNQATGKPFYARVAKEIFTYVLRDMTSPEGAFYSAEDADSEGVEGKFYLWSSDEVAEVLGSDRGRDFCRAYDIAENGNFEGKSIPNLIDQELATGWDEERQKLFWQREKRVHPFKDDKILTAWNGLMIAAMAFGARTLGDNKYALAAEKAVNFIWQKLRREDGRLLARYRDGEAGLLAYVDDYAFLIWGLIELYQATFKTVYLERAMELNNDMLKYFWDAAKGGLFLYGSDAEQLITRPKEIYDGAIPSGNSVAALNLLRLAGLTSDENILQKAQSQLKAFGGTVQEVPAGNAYFLLAAYFSLVPTVELTIVGDSATAGFDEMVAVANKYFHPDLLLTVKLPEKTGVARATAHICQNFACQAPVTEAKDLERLMAPNRDQIKV